MKFCSQCGSPRKVSDKFCGNCGTSFADETSIEPLSTESSPNPKISPSIEAVENGTPDSDEESVPIQTKDNISDPSATPKKKLTASKLPIFAALGISAVALIVAGVISQSATFDSQESSPRTSPQTSAESSCVGLGCYASVSAVADRNGFIISVVPYSESSAKLTSVEASPTNSWGEPLGAGGCEDFWNEMNKTSQGWELFCTTSVDVTLDDRPPVVRFRAELGNGESVTLTIPITSVSDSTQDAASSGEATSEEQSQTRAPASGEPYGGQCALVGPAVNSAVLATIGLGVANFDIDSPYAREFLERSGYRSFEEWILDVETLYPFLGLLDETQLTEEENNVLESLTRALEPGEMARALVRADRNWYGELYESLISLGASCDGEW